MAFQTAPAWMENSDEHHAVIYRQFAHMVTSGASGVVSESSLRVTERDGTADMSVDVATGGGFVPSTRSVHQGSYPVYNDAVINVPLTASHPTNDRIDRILVQVRDSAQDIALVQDDNRIYVIEGEPASVPELPPVDVDDWIELARVLVPAGATAITDADITDVREIISEQGSGTRLIEEIRLSNPGTAINFTGIPQTFSDLRLVVFASASSGTGDVTLRMQFNGVTTSTYRTIITQNQAGTIASSTTDSTSWRIGDVSDVTASNWSQAIVEIADYARSSRPSPTFQCIARRGGGLDRWTNGGLLTLDSGTAPVTSISVLVGTGSLSAGSVARLYGIR